jgi:hypothetical protein
LQVISQLVSFVWLRSGSGSGSGTASSRSLAASSAGHSAPEALGNNNSSGTASSASSAASAPSSDQPAASATSSDPPLASRKRKQTPGSAKGSVPKKAKTEKAESQASGRWTKAETELFATLSARRDLLTHWNKFQSEWDKERDGKAEVRTKSAKQLKDKYNQRLLTQKQRAERDAGQSKPKKAKSATTPMDTAPDEVDD